MKKILNRLLEHYLNGNPNNASTPFLVDNFFETYILTEYPSLKEKIEIYYLPLLEKYKIIKTDTANGNQIFKAFIEKEKLSNSGESLVGRIYSDLIYTQTPEANNTDVENEAELFFDSLSEEEKAKFNEKYNLGLDSESGDLPSLKYSDLKDNYQHEIVSAFKKEYKLEEQK